MPMKTTQMVAMSTDQDDLVSSGDSENGSDFGFTDDEDDEDDMYDDEDDYEMSGSGDGGWSSPSGTISFDCVCASWAVTCLFFCSDLNLFSSNSNA